MVPPSANSPLADDGIAFNEHSARLLRLRKLVFIGLLAWPLFGLVDLFIVYFVQPDARLWFFWTIRLAGMVPLGLSAWRLFSNERPGERELRATEVSVLTVLSVLISLTCAEYRGIDSPLALGVITLLVARGALAADHYRRGLLPVITVTLAHPLTIILLGLLSPTIGRQFTVASSLGGFLVNQFFLLGAASLSLFGGHALWALQRKVFESRSLGRYRLTERIGKGGMGEIWAAYHRALKRKVAVKILKPEKRLDKVAVARFEREVQATAGLTHPNTVRVFDYGVTDDGLCYYAMEYLDGSDLGSILREEGRLAPARVLSLILQATRALAEAHQRGIVHRDIKPENLFIVKVNGSEELLKVLDFGLVRVDNDGSDLTREGFAPGTPSYISPEVLQGKEADARSDVYALGCVIYHALSGRPPFHGKDVHQVLVGHMRKAPRPLSKVMLRPIAEAVEQVVMRCLEKDPVARYADAAELTRALTAALRSLRYAARARGSSTASARAPSPSALPEASSEASRKAIPKTGARAGAKGGSKRTSTSRKKSAKAARRAAALAKRAAHQEQERAAKSEPPRQAAGVIEESGQADGGMVSGLIELDHLAGIEEQPRAPITPRLSDSLQGRKVLVTSAAIKPSVVDPEDADTIIDPNLPDFLPGVN